MRIGPYSFDEYLERAAAFHGNPAPGLILGGVMVDYARSLLPEGTIFDAIVETPKCLPDAVQLLTLCSFGNGWMKVLNLGRYALALYDKYTGAGVRVWLDPDKLEAWPEIKAWYLKLKPKAEQDKPRLLAEMAEAGAAVLSQAPVQVGQRMLRKKSMGSIAVCPVCREAYPAADGAICRSCTGESPYESEDGGPLRRSRREAHQRAHASSVVPPAPELRAVPVEQAVGGRALHDMTEVRPGASKDAAFQAGQIITGGDVCRLQQMGRSRVYLDDGTEPGSDWVHENDAALAFARSMAGPGIRFEEPPREGKITFLAEHDGLLTVDGSALLRFNLVPGVMCATRQNHLVVEAGKPLAGCRAIPLYLPREDFEDALEAVTGLDNGPLLQVLPLHPLRVGVLVTGTEVFTGLVEDRFRPVVQAKVGALGCRVVADRIVPDDRKAIAEAVTELLEAGVELLVTTAGLSVDPDDVTRAGLQDAGLCDALYGMPVLPGAMTLVGRIGPNGQTRVLGVPACALYHKTTSFDLLLPRVLAGVEISRLDLARMAEGGFCLSCSVCTFPKCPFGK